MEFQYKKPIYDPFEVFNPPKSFIIGVVKQLKHKAYEELQKIQWYKEDKFPFGIPEARHKKLVSRIKYYQHRLSSWSEDGWNNLDRESSIGSEDIQRAKSVPIEDLYQGTIRKRGQTRVGICPFHSEKTGSFTIYLRNNSWYCFSCCRGGDSIDFIRNRDNLEFLEAVKLLISIQ